MVLAPTVSRFTTTLSTFRWPTPAASFAFQFSPTVRPALGSISCRRMSAWRPWTGSPSTSPGNCGSPSTIRRNQFCRRRRIHWRFSTTDAPEAAVFLYTGGRTIVVPKPGDPMPGGGTFATNGPYQQNLCMNDRGENRLCRNPYRWD